MCKNKKLVLLFLIALAAMLMPFFYTPYPLSDDAWQHIQKAECYIKNGGFPFRAFYDLGVEDCISFPNYPPLFDVLLGLGGYLGGMMLFARLFPSLLAALAVFAFYPLARKFLDEDAALIATALAVFAPEFMVLGSTNAQPQILGILFSLLCLNSLLGMLDSREDYRKHFCLTVVFSVLLVYSYTTYLFFVYFVFFVIILLKQRYGFIKDLMIIMLLTAIFSFPLILKFMSYFPPNAGLSIHNRFALDSYWHLLPLRAGLLTIIFAFFSRFKNEQKRVLFPFLFFLIFVSFFYLIAPFPPVRNLVFLIFPLSILGANGWQYFVGRINLRKYYATLTSLLMVALIIAGIFAVYFFVKLETVTDEEYKAVLWLNNNPGKIATFNFGPFNFESWRQYGGNIFDDLSIKLEANKIDYVVLTSKTPEIYNMPNGKAAEILSKYCELVFREKEVYIFKCKT